MTQERIVLRRGTRGRAAFALWRHNGGGNATFADDHVKVQQPGELCPATVSIGGAWTGGGPSNSSPPAEDALRDRR